MKNNQLAILKQFLKIQSVSTQESYLGNMVEARQFLSKLLSRMGFKTRFLKAQKHDAVFAQKITNPKLPTVLIYGHYDVQPPDPLDKWNFQPFTPTVIGNNIHARGASDDKGQIMIHLMAIKNLIDNSNSKLPLNIKFLIEGEEEIGSVSIAGLVNKYGKTLLECDYILVSDSEMIRKGQPTIDVSLRGLVYTELFLETGKHDLHSGQFGGLSENPAVVLARIITKLKNEDNHVLIPGFYKDIVKLTRKELADYNTVKASAQNIIAEGSLFGIGGGEKKYTLNERRWSQPTLDINGITSGYQGEGSKTIIPASASAKISMRLVPNQDPDKIYRSFVKYVKNLTPKSVKVKIINHANAYPYKADMDNPAFEILRTSFKRTFGKIPVFAGVGGSIGFVPTTVKALKVPCIMVGFGLPTDNVHAPNEHFYLKNYFQGIKMLEDFYTCLPQIKKTNTHRDKRR